MSAARASHVLLRAAIGLVFVALLVGMVALGTAPGARLTLRLLDELVPSELRAQDVVGNWLSGIVLHDVRYTDDSLRAEIGELRIAPSVAALLRGRLELRHLTVDGGRVTLASGGSRSDAAGAPALPAISSRIAVHELRAANVRIHVADTVLELTRAEGALTGPELRLDALELAVANIDVNGAGLATLAADGSQALVDARLQARSADPAAQIDVAARATVDLATEPWTVSLVWDRLAWRGTALGEISSPVGQLIVTPGTEPVAAALTARIEGARLPDTADAAAAATFDGRTFDIGAVGVATLGGELRASGAVDIADLAGSLHVTARALDPARLDARLGGNVGGDIDVEIGAQPGLRVVVTGVLDGELNGRALEGALRGRYADDVLDVERAELRVDDGRVQAAGTIAPTAVQLRFDADLPDVGAWYPPAHGAVAARGEARGTPGDPTVHAEIDARELALDGPAPRIDTLALVLDGTLAAHTIDARSAGAFGTLHANIEQRWDGLTLRGTVRDSTLGIVRAGTWSLEQPAGYVFGDTVIEAGPLCYGGRAAGELCATLRDRQLTAVAARVPSQLAAPWLPRGIELAGEADAELEFDWRAAPRGAFELTQPALRIELAADAMPTDGPRVLEVADLAIGGTLDEARFEASLGASLGKGGDRIDGALDLEPPTADGALTGHLTAALTDLALLDAFAAAVEEVRGRIDLDVAIDGSPADPRVAAELRADSLRANVPMLGVEITDGTVAARVERLDEPLIELDGRVCTVGCATFEGRARRRPEEPWDVTATLAGESLTLVGLPQLRAAVAPDLAFTARDGLWRLTGSLNVADAALTIVQPPRAAVRPAPETVVFGREEEPSKGDRVPAPLVLDLQARLGNVRFDGLGVAAELDGTLGVQRRPNGPLLVQGTTSVENGSFRAYGQELQIERGLLIFTGPYDDPTLDIRATRTVEGTTVGLAITGTASNARSEIFADDALSDSEAFARLVTGRSLARAGAADAEAVERAALSLGLSRVVPSLDRLGTNLGLSELGFAAGADDADGGLLVAGKQVGDDLLLRYKHGLFDDFASIELVYRITENLRLHTESGTAQSIDLVYEVDPTAVVPTLRDLARGRPSRPAESAEPGSAEPADSEPSAD